MFHLLLAIIYMSFISLGLPDGLLGAGWPSMYGELSVPISYSGIIFMIISLMTVVSALQSDRLTKLLGAGRVTAISVLMTAVALFGFSFSRSFIALCLWAVPYGLGAGSVDAALNNYVALHYTSRHMSWLHCMWGIGASLGPYFMSRALTSGVGWPMGYRSIGCIQAVLTAILFISLPLWKRSEGAGGGGAASKPLSLREVLRISGAKEIMICFFCYQALEQTPNLWGATYLVLYRGLPEEAAAGFSAFFYLGITGGRFLNGFLTMKFSDDRLIRMGLMVMALGVVMMILPFGAVTSLIGLILIGLGCAPVYPSIIHSTPSHFGADRSQALVGVQMASAYVGTSLTPPLFGLVARHISVALLPFYLAVFLVLMFAMHTMMLRKVRSGASA